MAENAVLSPNHLELCGRDMTGRYPASDSRVVSHPVWWKCVCVWGADRSGLSKTADEKERGPTWRQQLGKPEAPAGPSLPFPKEAMGWAL